MKRKVIIDSMLLTGAALSAAACAEEQKAIPSKPNVVFILADDLGWGDLSCYGQTNFQTPNIDRLASEGLRFTQCYSGTTVSAPSRSCLVTGTHSGHTAIRGNMELKPEGQFPLPADAETIDLIGEYPDKAEELKCIMEEAHVPNPCFPVVKGESAQAPITLRNNKG